MSAIKGRCQTCRHWSRDDDNADRASYGVYAPIAAAGRCTYPAQLWDATEWDDEGERVIRQKYADRLAFLQDGIDYYAAPLMTMPTFGCVQHSEREP